MKGREVKRSKNGEEEEGEEVKGREEKRGKNGEEEGGEGGEGKGGEKVRRA